MQILNYFAEGTEQTRTGRRIGMEIETDFEMEDGSPIRVEVTKAILARTVDRPPWSIHKLELGRQKIELAITPQRCAPLVEAISALQWLYRVAAQYGARPRYQPEVYVSGDLLHVAEERDRIWTQLDGQEALEHLCRCSSVQFTVDVHPTDAISWINRLWASGLHERDFGPNNRRWRAYIASSRANYRQDRYGGPDGFEDLRDYSSQLCLNDVVMHKGHPCRLSARSTPDLDIDLFLRSVWWHYRLRRYGSSLALEIRPIARRGDQDLIRQWEQIQEILDL